MVALPFLFSRFRQSGIVTFLAKLLLAALLLLGTHVHSHALSSGTTIASDCILCHAFGQPIVAAPLLVMLLLLPIVWVFGLPKRIKGITCRRQWNLSSRGPPLL